MGGNRYNVGCVPAGAYHAFGDVDVSSQASLCTVRAFEQVLFTVVKMLLTYREQDLATHPLLDVIDNRIHLRA